MACYQPLLALDNGIDTSTGKHRIKILPKRVDQNLELLRSRYGDSLMMLPCGHCVGCAMDYAKMWQIRIMLEYGYHESGCFLTLSNNNSYVEEKPSKQRLRGFIKRLRKHYPDVKLKFFGCGELGETTKRAHYHCIIFGVDFSEDRKVFSKRGLNYVYTSDILSKLWPYGFSLIGSLDLESAGYVSRYCDKKKLTGMDEGEFIIMSRGLGKRYFEEHHQDLITSDFVYIKGQKFKIPRYFLKLSEKLDFIDQLDYLDYKDRKKAVATSFRYGSSRSVHHEEEGMLMDSHAQFIKYNQKGVSRDAI